MASKPPNSRRNLDAAIERLSIAAVHPLQIRTVIANTVVGQFLPKGAVKGGGALKLRYGDSTTRFTRDLDAVHGMELNAFIEELDTALAQGWHGFTGKVAFSSHEDCNHGRLLLLRLRL